MELEQVEGNPSGITLVRDACKIFGVVGWGCLEQG